MTEERTADVSDAPHRFTGNLGAYRRELAYGPVAGVRHAAASPVERLSRRHDAKRARVTSRVTHPQESGVPNDATRARPAPLATGNRAVVAAAVGLVFIGAALGRPWETLQEQLPNAEPDRDRSAEATGQRPASSDGGDPSSPPSGPRTPVATATAAKTLDEIALVSLKRRAAESDKLVASLSAETYKLRDENVRLADINAALSDETTELNRELLDLEMTVVALHDERKNDPEIEPQVVYNFVNVPVGSDPAARDREVSGTRAPTIGRASSSYENPAAFSAVVSGEAERSEPPEEAPQQLADGSSDESMDALIQDIIERRRSSF